jgi:hypothetical protein
VVLLVLPWLEEGLGEDSPDLDGLVQHPLRVLGAVLVSRLAQVRQEEVGQQRTWAARSL